MSKLKVLWVEDDLLSIYPIIEEVKDHNIDVETAVTPKEALYKLEKEKGNFTAILLDIRMHAGNELSSIETRGGLQTGIALGRKIKENYPSIPIIGISVASEPEVEEWFKKNNFVYLMKPINSKEIVQYITQRKGKNFPRIKKPKVFVVHGHNHNTLHEFTHFIRDTLHLGSPIILREQPSLGRTIIEKFEEESKNIDLVFVLLTPDDTVKSKDISNDEKRRARQNVIFELGYFYAKLQRKRGRVILLHKENIELPTDISGIVYIDISNGIESSGEKIRRELKKWL